MATRTEIHKALKVNQGKCYVADAGDNRGRMVTNTYAAWSPGEGTLAEFHHYNLPFESGQYMANGTLSKIEGDAPNLACLAESFTGDACEWAEYEGRRISVETCAAWGKRGATEAHVLVTPEGSCYLDATYVQLVESECTPDEWRASTPLKPAAAFRGGQMVAIVMPVRVQ